MEQLAKLPGIADVNSDQRDHGLQEFVNVDHDTASRFGITSTEIDNTLYDAFGQSQVSTYVYGNESISCRDGSRTKILATS